MKIQLNKKEILNNINGRLLLESDHVWDKDIKEYADARNKSNSSARINAVKNPLQYLFNWYIRGPLTHLPSELYGKVIELIYKVFKSNSSGEIRSVQSFNKELEKIDGPYNREKKALKESLYQIDKHLTELKNKNFIHWILNPFVSGEGNSAVNHILKDNLEKLELKYSFGDTKSDIRAKDKQRAIEIRDMLAEQAKQNKGA